MDKVYVVYRCWYENDIVPTKELERIYKDYDNARKYLDSISFKAREWLEIETHYFSD